MKAKVFLNRASWVILFFLLIPAGAVQASKDAVPGDKVYPVKLILEEALLLMMKPSNSATSDIEMKFTKRRLLEVEQVADTPFAIKSLKSLNKQVIDTTESIEKVKNLDKQAELVDEYIQTLQETQTSLEQQQAAGVNPVNSYTHTTNQIVNNYYYEAPSEDSGANTAVQVEIQKQLKQTQTEIAVEIERLKQVALENERIKQQQQAEAAALEAEKQRQAAEKLKQKQQEAAQQAVDKAQKEELEQQQNVLEVQQKAIEHRQNQENKDEDND